MGAFTEVLHAAARGDSAAHERLLPLVYDELRRVAQNLMKGESRAQTVQATVLVHEAFLRLSGQALPTCNDKRHYIALAARLMRQILVDEARARSAQKRGEGATLLSLHEDSAGDGGQLCETIALHECLQKLTALDARQGQLVELRYFAGLELEECAEAMDISLATVKREWVLARAWLARELGA